MNRFAAVFLFLVAAIQVPLQAQVTMHDPAASAVVAADAKVEKLAGAMKFVEGPVWLAAEQALVFSDIPPGKLLTWTAAGGVKERAASEQGNGNTLDLDGRLVTCQHRARNVVRREADGKLTVLAERHDGKLLNSPNDVAVRNDGTIWFTDPTYGLEQRQKEQAGNHVYRLDVATGNVTVVQKDFDQPNGLCFAPDHQRLYIADSGKHQRVGAFPVQADGTLGKPSFWLDGGADGIRCDVQGNLFTTARDGIRVYAPDGKHLATIACPEQPANCAFGGADGTTLFVTARTSLYRLSLRVAGAPVPPRPLAAPGPQRK